MEQLKIDVGTKYNSIHQNIKALYGIIGKNLDYTLLEVINNIFFEMKGLDATYSIYNIPNGHSENIVNAIKSLGISGINVAVPYKHQIITQLDEISPEAKKIGLVDTIKIERNLSKGYNTQYYSFGKMLSRERIKIVNRDFYILGAGNIAKSVFWYLKDNGARNVTIVSRNIEKAQKAFSQSVYDCGEEVSIIEYKNIGKGYAIINTTSCGTTANIDTTLVDKNIFVNFEVAIDLVHSPNETLFLKRAKEKGKKAVSGLYMLVAQVMKMQEIWQNKIYNEKDEEQVFKEVLQYFKKCKDTVFLIGFMGSGKTVVGQYLAKSLGMNFIDCNKIIENDLNKSVSAALEEEGEQAFREKEYSILKGINLNKPTIIATGSGCVTYYPSYEYLKDKKVVYLYNDFNTIFGRIRDNKSCHIVKSRQEIENLYNYRFEVYEELAQYIIYCRNKSIREITNEIKEYL
ncbi:hypothetical protein AN639_00725 [Candidatus Epulonipiscium fishelsonii]|uniref:Uncharacterized protein n=1 Tax=Candidatus Epulonipiscium fishelsonii TaxID=77094 RepID=A0ACC8X7B8_9FIRM|nr:hypothetical protein AN396_12430 [Epulopiscium sp. SCG-B11WGA-EpuloA1]ONI41322.1 hypothetical protein AN639_00725 [Epulopiscium sp. SCG-B05WGA-EpuloA1]